MNEKFFQKKFFIAVFSTTQPYQDIFFFNIHELVNEIEWKKSCIFYTTFLKMLNIDIFGRF